MKTEVERLSPALFPPLLAEIPDPPEELFVRGTLPPSERMWITVVGSRKYTPYGRDVCNHLIAGLRGAPVVVVSGLALGIDSIAHRAALEADLPTVAIPGSGLDEQVLYPRSNHHLAREILEAGGALLSEFKPAQEAAPWTFPKRNRIMAGISHATLVIEAAPRSGTLITSRLATEYNRDVLAVPGSIFAEGSAGVSMLLRLGATPITNPGDILDALNLNTQQTGTQSKSVSDDEARVLEHLASPHERDTLIEYLAMPVSEASALLSAMEIKGLIREELGVIRRVR